MTSCGTPWSAKASSRDDPKTWINETPSHLQSLKGADVFKAIGSERTLGAIDDVIGAGRWKLPADWGAYFLLFPTRRPWTVPWNAWHLDHDYTAPVLPVDGLKVHSMFGDVAPRAGGMTIVAGSHHLVARHFADHPPRVGARAAQVRKQLMRSCDYLRELGTDPGEGDADGRIARFVDTVEVGGRRAGSGRRADGDRRRRDPHPSVGAARASHERGHTTPVPAEQGPSVKNPAALQTAG